MNNKAEWQPIETAPTGINILIFYKNNLNKGRIVKAQFIKKHTLEASDVSVCDDFAEYSEEHDNYFIPEGWYESIDNWEEFGSLQIYQGKPTHWMPLPVKPQLD